MKQKYKKVILLITVCLAGICMVNYSAQSQTKIDELQKSRAFTTTQLVRPTNENNNAKVTQGAGADTIINGDIEAVQNGILEKNAYEDINKLMKQYYAAKLSNKMSDFEPLVNSTDYINIKDNGRRTKYIESYDNITCYTRQGLQEKSFIVYVYHETKFKDINTVAPGLDRFYVKLKDNNEPYIYFGDVEKETIRYMKETDETEEVLDLVSKVNE
ncbi:MAG TPA: hypothetical protein DCM73_07975, partial [Clostridiales bacterium]|nr:hypothetical protein [Clostridiales bacterium]